MKKTISIILLVLVPVIFARGQTRTNSQVEQELRKITDELISATLSGDLKVYDRYLADDYLETDENGVVSTKAQVIANFQSPPAVAKPTIDVEDVKVRVYGDTAVMSFRGNFRAEVGGQKIFESFRITDVYMRRNGRWQLFAEHQSRIPIEPIAAKLNPIIYDEYVGQYEIAPFIIITVTREGDKLMRQITGEKVKTELLPENETTFFVKGQPRRNIFVQDEKGQVTQLIFRSPDGQEIRAKKIN